MPAMPRAGRAALTCVLVAVPVLAHAMRPRDNLFAAAIPAARTICAVGTFGSIYVSRDDGATWTTRESGTKRPLFSVAFADPEHGWIVGKSGTILHTDDGGETWKAQQSPIKPGKHLFKVVALDAKTAWAVGDWGAIVQTRDGGATWVDRSLGTLTVERTSAPGRMMQTLTDDVIFYDIVFPDRLHGFMAGEFGTLLATEDGGEHWRQIVLPTEKTIFGLDFTTPRDGWLVGIDGIIIHTHDGGQTWETQNGLVDTGEIEDVSFVQAMQNPGLYAVRVSGDYGVVVGDAGALFVTEDGGRHWTRESLPDKHKLTWMRDVTLASRGTAFAVGAAGFVVALDGTTVALPAAPPKHP